MASSSSERLKFSPKNQRQKEETDAIMIAAAAAGAQQQRERARALHTGEKRKETAKTKALKALNPYLQSHPGL